MSRCNEEIARLAAEMAQWRPESTWRTVRFADAADVRFVRHTVKVPRRALHSPHAYAGRFDEHLRAGYS